MLLKVIIRVDLTRGFVSHTGRCVGCFAPHCRAHRSPFMIPPLPPSTFEASVSHAECPSCPLRLHQHSHKLMLLFSAFVLCFISLFCYFQLNPNRLGCKLFVYVGDSSIVLFILDRFSFLENWYRSKFVGVFILPMVNFTHHNGPQFSLAVFSSDFYIPGFFSVH
jgi:hypothetical protein